MNAAHYAQLQASGLTSAVIKARGWRTVTDAADLAALGFADYQCLVPALLGPIHSPRGNVVGYQIRPDSPRIDKKKQKPVKYETQAKKRLRLDVPPPVRASVQNRKKPLVITEGLKKADAVAVLDIACVALTGVWAWCRKNKETGEYIPLKQWKHIPFKNRRVYICYDSDAKSNPKVKHAERELAKYLRSRGARVKIIRLPVGSNGAKVGADDYIAAGRTWPDFLAFVEGDALDEDFWKSRKALRRIRRAAYARGRSAEAGLGCVLARVAATVPYQLKLPAVTGSWASLTLIVGIAATPGAGKTTIAGVAEELLPFDPLAGRFAFQVSISSGEGMAEAFMGTVGEGKQKTRVQVRQNAFAYVDEGKVLDVLGERSGSSVMETLRAIHSGSAIGQSNATNNRTRIIPRGSYTYGIVVGLQYEAVKKLFGQTGYGTPQRFIWVSGTDPSIPDDPPTWDGTPLDWSPPVLSETTNVFMNVADSIVNEIRAANLPLARGESTIDPLDVHRNLNRLKIAGLLAVLDGRSNITEEDWALAGRIMDNSDRVRQQLLAELRRMVAQEDETRGRREGERASIAAEAKEKRDQRQAGLRIAEIVWGFKKPVAFRIIQQRLGKQQRELFQDAVQLAIREGWVAQDDSHYARGVQRPPKRRS